MKAKSLCCSNCIFILDFDFVGIRNPVFAHLHNHLASFLIVLDFCGGRTTWFQQADDWVVLYGYLKVTVGLWRYHAAFLGCFFMDYQVHW